MSDSKNYPDVPKHNNFNKHARSALQGLSGAIPFAGGLLAAAASGWGEREQQEWFDFLKQWKEMIEDELQEKQRTIVEIAMRLDLHDEEIKKRISSDEYKSLLRKAFREWGGTESEQKREYVRNILSNAAATRLASDDVVRLFLDWISKYSEMHFTVIAVIYKHSEGISRGEIWNLVGTGGVREDSAEADLFKLLFHDLSTGHVARQHRPVDYAGNYIKQTARKRTKLSTLTSAFDYEKLYVLTALGKQFVHYAMTDVAPQIDSDEMNSA
ncbi:hypothetical protein ACQ0P8_08955 [Halodesulfovibrio aestuarii]|uniref:Uncharacterized protein n=1 Tax=Halodesulfovibrio aestuarii TaxID=126333 RepID=A0A8G2C988_9BACT|nr:hypothetical protein [Halodesulfovibrio aestuarii]SHJ05365.1 hypothetical protein SAMN05660830_01495 [Halodesulfovibrio aestuarii]